jgi:TatD DNase family protein
MASLPVVDLPTSAGALPAPALVDSHCHIVFRQFDDDLDGVAARWRQAGVRALVHACVEPGEIPAIRALADRFPEMRYSVGVHPQDTEHWQADTPLVLREAALADDRVVAIGELGLDLYRQKNLEQQLAMLGPQLDLALDLDLPVIIHCRDAAEPMLAELRQAELELRYAAQESAGRVKREIVDGWLLRASSIRDLIYNATDEAIDASGMPI